MSSGPAPGGDVPGVDTHIHVGRHVLDALLVAAHGRILEHWQERQFLAHDLLDLQVDGLALLRYEQLAALGEQLVYLLVGKLPGVLAGTALGRDRRRPEEIEVSGSDPVRKSRPTMTASNFDSVQ